MANTFNLGNGSWAQKTEKLLAYNAENDNYKPLPFDFDRASTATRVNKQGLIETVGVDKPRIDFLNNTKGHLLLEPQSTNLITYSEDFSGWNSYQVTSNTTTSPSGSTVYFLDFEDARMFPTTSISNSTTYTSSIYLKANKVANVKIRNARNEDTLISLTTDWVRYEVTAISNSSSTNALLIDARFSQGLGASGLEIALWGAQLEAGSYATSYIPTQGSAVTRSADYTKIVNSPILQGTNQFTLFFEAKDFLLVNDTNAIFDNLMFVLGAGENAYDSGTGVHIYKRTWYYYNGSSNENIGVCYNGLTDSKFAISYDGTKFIRYAGGIKLGEFVTSASMVNWDTITTGAMDDAQNDDRVFNLSDLRLYNTALTDAELIALTS